jgi:hypothetical protein
VATTTGKISSAIVLKSKPVVADSAHDCDSCGTKRITNRSERTSRKSSRLKWVLVVKMAECQGVNSCWFCLPPTILPEPPGVRDVDLRVPESFVVQSERLQTSTQKPPLPPPRLV